jgi:predicted alpha/beta hydrolase
MIKEELIKLQTDDSENISLWKFFNQQDDSDKNIFLTHGTFSNKKICSGIAMYFVKQGYICWIMEWRNHGESSKVKKKFDFSTIAEYDIKAVFDFLFGQLKIQNIDCITHSGGGICLTIFLINFPEYIPKIKSITMFSCQAFGACHNFSHYIKVLLSKVLSFIIGVTPGKYLGLGEHNESYNTMKQWFNWNLSKQFIGSSGYDYRKSMELITIPILSICSKGDGFIAPKQGCKKYLNAFKNSQNIFMLCSIENGYAEDYNHGRVILSKNSEIEIWPKVFEWIKNQKKIKEQ